MSAAPPSYDLIARGKLHPHRKKLGIGLGGRRLYFEWAEVEALREAQVPPAEEK